MQVSLDLTRSLDMISRKKTKTVGSVIVKSPSFNQEFQKVFLIFFCFLLDLPTNIIRNAKAEFKSS